MRRYLLVSLLAMAAPAYGADVRPIDMTAASPLSGTEAIWCQLSGPADRKCTPSQIATYFQSLVSGDCTMTGGAITCTKSNGLTAGVTIASGTAALGTSAVASGVCGSATTVAATGVATTDTINAGFNGDPTAVTGYTPTGMLTIVAYPTSGNVNFKQCNLTAISITPSALTINWRVQR